MVWKSLLKKSRSIMEICHAYGCPYEDYENAIMELSVKLDVNETVSLGDIIKI